MATAVVATSAEQAPVVGQAGQVLPVPAVQPVVADNFTAKERAAMAVGRAKLQASKAKQVASVKAAAAAPSKGKAPVVDPATAGLRNALIRQIINVQLRCPDDSTQLLNGDGTATFTVANTTARCPKCKRTYKVRKSMFDVVI